MINKDIMERFYDAYWFVDEHPAFFGGLFRGMASLDFQVSKCCKNGLSKLDIIHVYRDEERFEEFFGKGLQESICNEPSILDHVWVPYKKFYGEEWSFDHVEVFVSGGSHFYVKGGHYGEEWTWNRFHDFNLDTGGNSYEEAVISFADLVKDLYGDYSSFENDNSIIPQWIRDNNKENPPFGDKFENMFKDGKINRNPKYISLSDFEINALWWHLHQPNEDISGGEMVDITKYLSKDNYSGNN